MLDYDMNWVSLLPQQCQPVPSMMALQWGARLTHQSFLHQTPHAGAVVCRINSKGHSVLHGQAAAKEVTYWDRAATALKAGPIREVSVYYGSKQECIAGIKLTYGSKRAPVSHLMGTERGPGFYEKLLMLDQKEHINRVDIGYSPK
jgi:hypothetical protein